MRMGIDLGGTKIEAIALGDGGSELFRRRVPTPSGDYQGTLTAIAELVSSIENKFGRKGSVGIGTPGAISPRTGLIKNSNSVVLNGRPLDRDLAATLGRAVRIENDANCFALSEAVDGAARDASVVFGVIIGTGAGGGIVIDRRVVAGHNRIAGEWGHNPLPWPRAEELPGPPCYCGKSGCLETFLSGAGLAREFRIRTGKDLNANEISSAADAGARGMAIRVASAAPPGCGRRSCSFFSSPIQYSVPSLALFCERRWLARWSLFGFATSVPVG